VTDIEQLLREDMDRRTAGLTISPGLAGRAYRRRRRRMAARATCATVAAAAVAISATVFLGQPAGQTRALTTAYVVSRSEAALAVAAGEDPIISITGSDGNAGMSIAGDSPMVAYAQTHRWYHGTDFRVQELNTAGQPVDDDITTGSTETEFFYPAKAWWQNPAPWATAPATAQKPPTCASDKYFGADGSPLDWAADIKEALHCGLYKVAGTEQVGTVAAIKLMPVHPDHITAVLWLDPGTYLPIKIEAFAVNDPQPLTPQFTDYVTWLPPTSANLAVFAPAAPSGFTQIPGRPVMNCTDQACYTKWDKLQNAWYAKYVAPRLAS
jgi:hypothetical protein